MNLEIKVSRSYYNTLSAESIVPMPQAPNHVLSVHTAKHNGRLDTTAQLEIHEPDGRVRFMLGAFRECIAAAPCTRVTESVLTAHHRTALGMLEPVVQRAAAWLEAGNRAA